MLWGCFCLRVLKPSMHGYTFIIEIILLKYNYSIKKERKKERNKQTNKHTNKQTNKQTNKHVYQINNIII